MPRRVRALTGARNMRKATVKIRSNAPSGALSRKRLYPKILIFNKSLRAFYQVKQIQAYISLDIEYFFATKGISIFYTLVYYEDVKIRNEKYLLTTLDILLLGCCDRFSFTKIKICSQLVYNYHTSHPTPLFHPPPSYWISYLTNK